LSWNHMHKTVSQWYDCDDVTIEETSIQRKHFA
jgi:hypothetical protein